MFRRFASGAARFHDLRDSALPHASVRSTRILGRALCTPVTNTNVSPSVSEPVNMRVYFARHLARSQTITVGLAHVARLHCGRTRVSRCSNRQRKSAAPSSWRCVLGVGVQCANAGSPCLHSSGTAGISTSHRYGPGLCLTRLFADFCTCRMPMHLVLLDLPFDQLNRHTSDVLTPPMLSFCSCVATGDAPGCVRDIAAAFYIAAHDARRRLRCISSFRSLPRPIPRLGRAGGGVSVRTYEEVSRAHRVQNNRRLVRSVLPT